MKTLVLIRLPASGVVKFVVFKLESIIAPFKISILNTGSALKTNLCHFERREESSDYKKTIDSFRYKSGPFERAVMGLF